MTWNNVPYKFRIVNSQITFLSWQGVTNLHVINKINQLILKTCVDKNILTPFEHDVHVRVFTMMHMILNCILTRYIKACFHQGLNLRPNGNTLKL